jgi:hypothetical protein
LPQLLVIPSIMTLRTLADVRELLGHLPEEYRAKATWHYVATKLDEAAHGEPVIDIVVPPRMVLSMVASDVARSDALALPAIVVRRENRRA